jgi:hypothetical protein
MGWELWGFLGFEGLTSGFAGIFEGWDAKKKAQGFTGCGKTRYFGCVEFCEGIFSSIGALFS